MSKKFQSAQRHQGRTIRLSLDARRICGESIRLTVAALVLGGISALATVNASAPSTSPELSSASAKFPAMAQLLGVTPSSQPSSTRVAIALSNAVSVKVGRLSNPDRLYFDLARTQISSRMPSRKIAVDDGFVEQIRIGTNQSSVTRLVLDLRAPVPYRISTGANAHTMLITLGVHLDELPPSADAPDSKSAGTSSRSYSVSPAGRAFPAILQSGNVTPGSSPGPETHGTGEKTTMNFAGTPSPRNVVLFGLNLGSNYDDNVFGNNINRSADESFVVGPSVTLRRETDRFHIDLNYHPYFRIYRTASELNRLDESLSVDSSYQMTSRFSARARAGATYTNGIFLPSQNDTYVSGLSSSTSTGSVLYTPTERQVGVNARVDLSDQVSPHDSIGVYGGGSLLDFIQPGSTSGGLQNTQEVDAGILYERRMSLHTTVGANYQFQDISFGASFRTNVHSLFFSYAQQFSPTVTVSVFGGPQFSHVNQTISLFSGLVTVQSPTSLVEWALGGTVTKRTSRTVFTLNAQHQVSNGGGFIAAVVGTSGGGSIRRELPGHWDAVLSGNYARNTSLGTGTSPENYYSETAGFGLEHSLNERISLRLGYDFIHQKGSGATPLFANMDRNLVSIQFFFKLRPIQLGQQ